MALTGTEAVAGQGVTDDPTGVVETDGVSLVVACPIFADLVPRAGLAVSRVARWDTRHACALRETSQGSR